jgi:hypothetical protein
MAITFDGTTTTITLESGITEIDIVDDIYSAWKDWMLASPLNRKYPQAFRSDGGSPLSSIINQGSYIFLNNTAGWRIKPPEEDITIYLTGNLAVEDTSLPAFIPTTGDYTAAILGLQPVTQGVTSTMADQLAYGSFAGGVTVDAVNGVSRDGIDQEIGMPFKPVNNLTDALLIIEEKKLPPVFYVLGDLTIDSGGDYSGMSFVGESKSKSELNISSDANVVNSEFREAHIMGTLDGEAELRNCEVHSVTYINGYIEICALLTGTITLGGGQTASIMDCWAKGEPVIDMGGSGQSLVMQNYFGDITLKNKTGVDLIEISLGAGHVILENTVTAGTIECHGIGKLIDTSGNDIPSGTWNGVTIINDLSDGRQVSDIWRMLGLDVDNPMTIATTGHTSTSVNVTITDNGNGSVTLQRT